MTSDLEKIKALFNVGSVYEFNNHRNKDNSL